MVCGHTHVINEHVEFSVAACTRIVHHRGDVAQICADEPTRLARRRDQADFTAQSTESTLETIDHRLIVREHIGTVVNFHDALTIGFGHSGRRRRRHQRHSVAGLIQRLSQRRERLDISTAAVSNEQSSHDDPFLKATPFTFIFQYRGGRQPAGNRPPFSSLRHRQRNKLNGRDSKMKEYRHTATAQSRFPVTGRGRSGIRHPGGRRSVSPGSCANRSW